jgi:hypothetical protein
MDQAKPPGEEFLWHFTKRCKDSDLDRYGGLSHFGHHQREIFSPK